MTPEKLALSLPWGHFVLALRLDFSLLEVTLAQPHVRADLCSVTRTTQMHDSRVALHLGHHFPSTEGYP